MPSPERWTEELLRYREIGVDGFVFWPGDAPNPDALIHTFAEQVVPAVAR